MAKGDSNASQTAIDTQGGRAQNNLTNLWGQNTDRTTNFQNLFSTGVKQNLNDYSGISQQYKNFLNPQQAAPTQPKQDFGNLQDPNTWMGLVGNPTQLSSWVKQNAPGADQSLVDYYTGKIQGQPGANPTEQAGSAQYWMDKLASDPKASGNALSGNNFGNAMDTALGGYQGFSENGGFSPQDIQNLRARAIAPTRAIYQNAQNNIDRQRTLQGGYSPNYTAASAKLARDESQGISDANVNADASIAQLQQQGKLYGLGGLASTGSTGRSQNLGAIGGQTGLYGTTPGLTNTFGNQVLQSGEQGIQLGGLQNNLAKIIMDAQNQKANIPGNFQSALGNISSLFGLGGDSASFLSKLFKGFGGGGDSSGNDPSGNPFQTSIGGSYLDAYDPYSLYGPMGLPAGSNGEDMSQYYTPGATWGG